jgi:predicted nucleotidyltransferase
VSDESNRASLEEIAALLVARGVEFLVIGGQAEYLFGSPRTTVDVDLCYKRDKANFGKLAECLKSMNARLRDIPDGLPFILDARTLEMGANFTFKTDLGDLDLLSYVEPVGEYEQLMKCREIYDLGAFQVSTIGLEDLLRVKLHINRVKDQESIVQLRAILKIRNENEARPPITPT